jgi:hypothetical protein
MRVRRLQFTSLNGHDPAAFNLERRNLTIGQRGMALDQRCPARPPQ